MISPLNQALLPPRTNMTAISKLEAKIEALLFFKAESVELKKLAEILGASKEDVSEALLRLEESLKGRGVALMRNGGEVMLGTSPDMSGLIESVLKEELHRDIGRAGVETLSIIAYMGPVSRAEIDYIRGVSSTFIIRNLLIRGLIERTDNPADRRSFLYQPTFELLSYLGARNLTELPEYETLRGEMRTKVEARRQSEQVLEEQEGRKEQAQ